MVSVRSLTGGDDAGPVRWSDDEGGVRLGNCSTRVGRAVLADGVLSAQYRTATRIRILCRDGHLLVPGRTRRWRRAKLEVLPRKRPASGS